MNNIVNNFVLELHVPNFATSKEFYAIFGFSELHYDPTSGGGSDLGYLVIKREDTIGRTLINFYGDDERVCEHSFFKDFPTNTRRGYEVEITIPVSDVDGLWDSIKDKMRPDQIAQPLKMKRWNKKDFRVVDPFGFYVRFTELVDWGQ
jgi:hypothetical protein